MTEVVAEVPHNDHIRFESGFDSSNKLVFPESDLSSLGRDLIVDKIYRILERKIITGGFPQGFKLVERELAAVLGVSRSPVREALLILENDGLARRLPGGGRVVNTVSERDVIELYELRQMAEGFAVRVACLHSTDDHLSNLQATIEKMKNSLDDLKTFRSLNEEFHRLLVEPCQNQRLRDLHARTIKQVRWCLTLTISKPMEPCQSYEKHVAIFERYVQKQAEPLEQLVRQHIKEAMERFVQSIRDLKTDRIAA